jgi:uncharacterized protein (TIGR02118 family)
VTKISILYPNIDGAKFDMQYYVQTHMVMSIERLSKHPGFMSVSVARGVCGESPDSSPDYIAMCHFEFDAAQSFVEAFTPHYSFLRDDMVNYTSIKPIIQFSEVLIAQQRG